MDDELRIRIDYWIIRIGFTMMAVGITGEILGWWNDLGVWLTALGAVGGVGGLLDVNGRATLTLLRPMAQVLANVDAKQDIMIGGQAQQIDGQERILDAHERMLDAHERLVNGQGRVIEILDARL